MSDDYDWTPHLQEGEEVLWQGRPDDRFELFPTRLDYFMMVFSALVGPPILWLHIATAGSNTYRFLVVLMFLVGVPSYFFLRPWLDSKRRKRLRYAITNLRVVRVDAKNGNVLSEKSLSTAKIVETTRHNTLRINPDETEFAKVPMDWRIMRTDQPRKGIGGLYFGMQMAVNGYDEYGMEFRMLENPEQVKEILLSRISNDTP